MGVDAAPPALRALIRRRTKGWGPQKDCVFWKGAPEEVVGEREKLLASLEPGYD